MTDISDVIIDLAGPLARYVDDNAPRRGPAFFRPYKSAGDVALGVASIVAAPVVFPVASVGFLLVAGYQLLQAIANTLTGHFSNAIENLLDSGAYLFCSLSSVLVAPVSPLVNLIDLIGSIVTTSTSPAAIRPA